jgi:hypothetical protein
MDQQENNDTSRVSFEPIITEVVLPEDPIRPI